MIDVILLCLACFAVGVGLGAGLSRVSASRLLADEASRRITVLVNGLDAYQSEAAVTDNKDIPEVEAQKCYAIGLAGEAGEAADYLKKVFWHGHTLDRAKLIKELGDVLWYVAMVAFKFGISLNEIAAENIKKLRARYGAKFSAAASINRADNG